MYRVGNVCNEFMSDNRFLEITEFTLIAAIFPFIDGHPRIIDFSKLYPFPNYKHNQIIDITES